MSVTGWWQTQHHVIGIIGGEQLSDRGQCYNCYKLTTVVSTPQLDISIIQARVRAGQRCASGDNAIIHTQSGAGDRAGMHKCTTFTKPIQLFLKWICLGILCFNTVNQWEKSSHRVAAGRKWKNKFRKSVGAVVFNQTCASIYNLSMGMSVM